MADTVQTVLTAARYHLKEPTARLWNDALELVPIVNRGLKDLWRSVLQTNQDYVATNDVTNVSQAASATTLTGVPANLSIVRAIEPRTLSDYPNLIYRPKPFTHDHFRVERARDAADPAQIDQVFYWPMGAGGPVAAPTIEVAPKFNAALNLRVVYVPTLATLAVGGTLPLPGECTQALVAWTVAYALAKTRADRQPDAGWLEIYKTEKISILEAISPRQADEEEVVEAMFESLW